MAVDRIIWKIVLDFVILAVFGFALLSISLWAEPFQRGYFVDDESLRLPFKEQQVSEALLAGVGFALNAVMIIIIEVYRDKQGKGTGEKYLSSHLVPGWVWQSYISIGVFTFGAACQHLTSNSAKYVIGRLRPHFFDVCRPVPASVPEPYEYIMNFTCSGTTDQSKLTDMRLSFPSAHSSFAMYSAVFFILYIQSKAKWRGSKLVRHAIQFAVLMGAWYVGLSRVVDHKHHAEDVAAGFFIGLVIGVLVFVYVLKPKKFGLPGSWHDSTQQTELPRPA